MATGVGGRKCDWQHSIAHPQKSPYRRKNLADIFYTSRVINLHLIYFTYLLTTRGAREHEDQLRELKKRAESRVGWRHRQWNLPIILYMYKTLVYTLVNGNI